MNHCCGDLGLTAKDIEALARISHGKIYTDEADPLPSTNGMSQPEPAVMICNGHILFVLPDRIVEPLLRRPVSIDPIGGVRGVPIHNWRQALVGEAGAVLIPIERTEAPGTAICYRSLTDHHHLVTPMVAYERSVPATYLVNDYYLTLVARLGFALHEFASGGPGIIAGGALNGRWSLAIVDRGRIVGALAPLSDVVHCGRRRVVGGATLGELQNGGVA